MPSCFELESPGSAVPVRFFTKENFPAWLSRQDNFLGHWAQSTGFLADPNAIQWVPGTDGHLSEVWCGISDSADAFWAAGQLPLTLPQGLYHFVFEDKGFSEETASRFAMAFGLGSYQFSRYRKPLRPPARLCLNLPKPLAENMGRLVDAIFYIRDLINLPTEDMGPSELAAEMVGLGKRYHASVKQIIGAELQKKGFAAILAVGRASDDPPCLLDLQWGNKNHPKVTLVGKGVCFDTGGLDLKPASAMQLMKKDMAGAAHVLGLAQLIMASQLPVCLRVLIPAVENAVGGSAYRPGDVIAMHSGKTVEVGNTDAEGRLVLADALSLAAADKPDLLIDIATLTGAARVAVGTEISAFFCDEAGLAGDLLRHGDAVSDPLWRLPLYAPYRSLLDSPIADLNNVSPDGYAGAIIAGLFLREFVPVSIPWVHFDMMAWNIRARPGRPLGGEAMAIRTLFSYLCERFGSYPVARPS